MAHCYCPEMPRVRLSDVANAAHVSASTASAALAGKPGVAPETRAAVVAIAQNLGYRPDSAARRLRRQEKSPVVAILVDPLLTEGANVASMSFAGRLLARLSEAAVHHGATAIIIPSDRTVPPADAAVVIETGTCISAPPDLGFAVPIVYTGVPWSGWTSQARVTATFDFDGIAATVLSALQHRGCTAIAVCRPQAAATWLHRLSDGCRTWFEREGQPARFHDYWAESAEDAERCGFEAAAAADGVFLISNRRQGQVVSGVRRADVGKDGTTPLVVLGEGVTEAAYMPAVGVLSLAPLACADLLIETALWAIEHPDEVRHVDLPYRYTDFPGE